MRMRYNVYRMCLPRPCDYEGSPPYHTGLHHADVVLKSGTALVNWSFIERIEQHSSRFHKSQSFVLYFLPYFSVCSYTFHLVINIQYTSTPSRFPSFILPASTCDSILFIIFLVSDVLTHFYQMKESHSRSVPSLRW